MRSETPAVPPKIAVTSSPGFFVIAVLVLAVLGSGAVLFFFDPAQHRFYPGCVFHSLTGWNCPGCGATRAAYQLLHGHWLAALHDNALFVVTLAAVAGIGLWWAVQSLRRRPVKLTVPAAGIWAFLAIALVFTVLRNLPAFAWLSP